MDGAMLHDWAQALFRWTHVVAGVLWIGLLYFFNWVNAPFAKTLDADSKKKVVPELLPRALYFFRWGAMYTWITGVLLLVLVYYMQGQGLMAEEPAARGMATGASLAAFIVGPIIYDLLWKSGLAKNPAAGVVVSFILLVGVMAGLHYGAQVSARALYIHIGALFGTTMFINVWMRIWPAQRKIIAATKSGTAPDAAVAATAALRSRHNTYMSVPLMFTMVSSHYPSIFGVGQGMGWVALAVIVALGWFVTWLIYKKSAGATPAAA